MGVGGRFRRGYAGSRAHCRGCLCARIARRSCSCAGRWMITRSFQSSVHRMSPLGSGNVSEGWLSASGPVGAKRHSVLPAALKITIWPGSE